MNLLTSTVRAPVLVGWRSILSLALSPSLLPGPVVQPICLAPALTRRFPGGVYSTHCSALVTGPSFLFKICVIMLSPDSRCSSSRALIN